MMGSAMAADVTEAEIAGQELVHEERVQKQMELLQKERDAAFLKQLEAEMLLMQQQDAANAAAGSTAP